MAENANNTIMLLVVTPYKNFYEGRVDSVVLPGLEGKTGIMAGHSPLVVALTPGICDIKIGNEVKHCVLSEGYAEIGQHLVLVVCNAAEWPEDLSVHRALDSYKIAFEKYHEYPLNSALSSDWRHALRRAKMRIHTIELYGSQSQKLRLEQLRDEQKNQNKQG